MDREQLLKILNEVATGAMSIDDCADRLRTLPYEDLGFAKVDHHRPLRNGFAEAIYCQGKTPDQVGSIFEHLAAHGGNVLATRADALAAQAVRERIAEVTYHEQSRIIYLRRTEPSPIGRPVAVVTAGTADLPVAEEAALTVELNGYRVDRVFDVGVAGIHRLFGNASRLTQAGTVIVVAGMDGALASVVGGLLDRPVVAVPTSVGYGASFGGLAALLSMLNSCAAGIGVVNIDNGFGAGMLASVIMRSIGEGV